MRKRNKKRVAAVLLAAAVGISCFPTGGITVSAAEENGTQVMELVVEAEASDFSYEELKDGTIEITKYNGSGGDVSIPEQIDGKSVTSIGNYTFYECSNLTSIEIPSSVTSIGVIAFVECSKELVIRGTKGSYAETYASANGISFQATNTAKKSNKVTVTKTSYSLTASAKKQTIASLGAKAIGGMITYVSDNKNVTVTSKGKVTIAKNFVGIAKITVTAQSQEYETATATITVNVAKASQSFKKAVTKKTVKQGKKRRVFRLARRQQEM